MIHQRIIFPVGQGGFAMEQIRDYTVVFDCGTTTSRNMLESCVDHLHGNVEQVDFLFISHFDKDHVNGIRYLLNHVRVKTAVTAFIPAELRFAYNQYTGGAYDEIMEQLRGKEVEVEEVQDQEKQFGHRDAWEWIAKRMMSDAEFSAIMGRLHSYGIGLNQLRDAEYLESRKEVVNSAFKDAFGVKGPNAKGLVILSQPAKDVITSGSNVYYGNCSSHRPENKVASYGESSCLYVGDADLKNRHNSTELYSFLRKNRYENPLLLMQIPHHGSASNVGTFFESDFSARFYFVNDRNSARIQRNRELYNSLNRKNAILVSRDVCQDTIMTNTLL